MSTGLGEELEDEIDAVLTVIARFPKAAPQWKDRVDRWPAGPGLEELDDEDACATERFRTLPVRHHE